MYIVSGCWPGFRHRQYDYCWTYEVARALGLTGCVKTFAVKRRCASAGDSELWCSLVDNLVHFLGGCLIGTPRDGGEALGINGTTMD